MCRLLPPRSWAETAGDGAGVEARIASRWTGSDGVSKVVRGRGEFAVSQSDHATSSVGSARLAVAVRITAAAAETMLDEGAVGREAPHRAGAFHSIEGVHASHVDPLALPACFVAEPLGGEAGLPFVARARCAFASDEEAVEVIPWEPECFGAVLCDERDGESHRAHELEVRFGSFEGRGGVGVDVGRDCEEAPVTFEVIEPREVRIFVPLVGEATVVRGVERVAVDAPVVAIAGLDDDADAGGDERNFVMAVS